jgi:hypothetical protein
MGRGGGVNFHSLYGSDGWIFIEIIFLSMSVQEQENAKSGLIIIWVMQ